jgi:hypothetical protein
LVSRLVSDINKQEAEQKERKLSRNRHVDRLEHFPNSRAVLSCVQGGFLLRKRPRCIPLFHYSNWKNAIAKGLSQAQFENE